MPLKPTPWPVSKIKENPAQKATFRALSNQRRRELAEDIKNHGFREPLEVLPDGTLVKGHERWQAAKMLGLKTVPVVVRHDLANDPAAAEREFLRDNRLRKQLDTLDEVRVEVRLILSERDLDAAALDHSDRRDMLEELAKRTGLSLKHAGRLLTLVLDLPAPLQFAVSAGRLGIVEAVRVAGLPAEAKLRLADAIETGADPKELLAEYGTRVARSRVSPTAAFRIMMAAIARGAAACDGRASQVRPEPYLAAFHLAALAKLQTLVEALTPVMKHLASEYERRRATSNSRRAR